MYHATPLNGDEATLGPFFADQYSSSVSSTERYGLCLCYGKDENRAMPVHLPQNN
jgi:hypothetical protein